MSSKKKMFISTRLSRWKLSITGMNASRYRGQIRHRGAVSSKKVMTGSPALRKSATSGHCGTCQPIPVSK